MRIRALVCLVALTFSPSIATAALVTGDVGSVSSQINIPAADAVAANAAFLTPINPSAAVGLGVAGATGGLTHPTCVAAVAAGSSAGTPCLVPVTGFSIPVVGVCAATVCSGTAYAGVGGVLSAIGSIASIASAVSGVLSALLGGGSSAPDSPPPIASETIAPISAPLTSGLISTDTDVSQSLDLSLLFTQSADIVRDLLRSLQSSDVQPSGVDR